MQVTKLRVRCDDDGLVPAGQYFKRLADALREANERAGNVDTLDAPPSRRVACAPWATAPAYEELGHR